MEKILLAIDPFSPNRNSLAFACYIGRLTNSKITGIFLEHELYQEASKLKPAVGGAYGDGEINESHSSREELIQTNISSFKEAAINRGVNFISHRDRGIPAYQLIEESRFADAMIIDPSTSFNRHSERTPTNFIKDVLKGTECPAIIAPEDFEAIEEIVFTYDGSQSSVFAIKQFTYLFPQLHDKRVTVVHINDTGEWHDTNRFKLKELLKNYYFDLHVEILKGTIYKTLFEYVFAKKNSFLVMGAYGRNALSRFFKPSKADLIIKTIKHPIFIAHY
jgi:hypothetical protein